MGKLNKLDKRIGVSGPSNLKTTGVRSPDQTSKRFPIKYANADFGWMEVDFDQMFTCL